MLFDIRRLAGTRSCASCSASTRRGCPSRCPRPTSSGPRASSAARCRWRGSPATSRRRSSARPATAPGMAKNTYGTGSFVLLNTGAEAPRPPDGLLATVAWGLGDEVAYALEASIFVTGAAVQWLRDGLGIIEEAAETEALAASLDSNDGVYFVPALTGLGSPHWDPYARGTIVGLTRGSGRAHLARAALEAIAYQTVDAVRAQEAAAGRAAGGAEGRRRRRRQPLADAVPGRRARRPGGRARDRRDDRARRRLPGRDRDRAAGAASRWGRCGARRPATSRAMGADERESLLADWAGPSSAPAAGPLAVTGRGRRRSDCRPCAMQMRPQTYKDPRPAEYFTQFHDGRPQGRRLDLHLRPHRPHPADAADLPGAGDRRRERAARGRPGPRAQPLQPDGPLLRRRLPAAEDPLHGQIADVRPARPHLHLQARRRLPGAPRPPRRGGLQDRLRADRPGGDAARLRRGRPLALARAGRAETGHRPDRAGVGRADRPGRDPRLGRGAGLEAAALPQGHGPVRRADELPGRAEPSRERQLEAADARSSPQVREMYERDLATRSERELGRRSPDRAPA